MERDFQRFLDASQEEVKSAVAKIATIVKVEGLQFISDNFVNQGFEASSGSYKKWQQRKFTKNKKLQKRAGRSILVDSGNLRRAWDSESRVSGPKVVFSNSMPYAQVHNEGGHAGRGAGFEMPQRQMIGDSQALDDRILLKLNKLFDQMFG
jgi:phage gpG-like protein